MSSIRGTSRDVASHVPRSALLSPFVSFRRFDPFCSCCPAPSASDYGSATERLAEARASPAAVDADPAAAARDHRAHGRRRRGRRRSSTRGSSSTTRPAGRSLVIARTVAAIPRDRTRFPSPTARRAHDRPDRRANPQGDRRIVRRRSRTGAASVRRTRVTSKLGKSLRDDPGEPVDAMLAGHEFVGVQTGSSAGPVRAKVPLRDAHGRVVGLVSVGVLERNISDGAARRPAGDPDPADRRTPAWGGRRVPAGTARIKRQTFGLEPERDRDAARAARGDAARHP